MNRSIALLLAVVLAVAACDAVNPSPTPSFEISSPQAVDDTGFLLRIDEIGLGPDGWVSLTNFTSQPAGLGGLSLCQNGGCVALPEATIDGGATGRIAIGGGGGLEDVVATAIDIELPPANGEIGLFAGDDPNDPADLRIYLEWGSSPHDGTATAVEAGIWFEGSYAPTADNATRLYRNTETGLWLFDTR